MHDLLTENPRYFQRVRDDVDRIVKAARNIFAEEPPHVEDHDFLNACITETTRQHSIGTWIRWAEKPFILPPGPSGEPRVIPCGFVTVTTEAIRTDKNIYYDCEIYNPERYFQAPFASKSEYQPTMTNRICLDSLRAPPINMNCAMQTSFGVGSHHCPGRPFAYRMIGGALSLCSFVIDAHYLSQPRSSPHSWRVSTSNSIKHRRTLEENTRCCALPFSPVGN